MKRKTLILILSVVLLLECAFAGTLAWLTDTTDEVKNTFTVGNIDIELDETTGDTYKMIPGNVLAKDPFVTVVKDSEDCWLFVKIVENGGNVTVIENGTEITYKFEDFLTYNVDAGWKNLAGHENVYYREVSMSSAEQIFQVLENNQVTVKDTVTKQMMDALKTAGAEEYPKLTFTAYAIQKDNIADEQTAWKELNSSE